MVCDAPQNAQYNLSTLPRCRNISMLPQHNNLLWYAMHPKMLSKKFIASNPPPPHPPPPPISKIFLFPKIHHHHVLSFPTLYFSMHGLFMFTWLSRIVFFINVFIAFCTHPWHRLHFLNLKFLHMHGST